MTPSQLAHYRQALTKLKARAQGDLAQLAADAADAERGDNGLPLHGDVADVGEELEIERATQNLIENEKDLVANIDAALGRMSAGQYGVCIDCRAAIPAERLRLLPHAARCVACAAKAEGA